MKARSIKTPLESCNEAWLTDSPKVNISEYAPPCTGVLLPITSTYSCASSTMIAAHSPGMGRLPPALLNYLQRTDNRTPKSAATNPVLRLTDSGFSNLHFSSILSSFSSETSRVLVENSRSPAPAT